MSSKVGHFYRDDEDDIFLVSGKTEMGNYKGVLITGTYVGDELYYEESELAGYQRVMLGDFREVKPVYEFGDRVLVRYFEEDAWQKGLYVSADRDGTHNVHIPGQQIATRVFTDSNVKPDSEA